MTDTPRLIADLTFEDAALAPHEDTITKAIDEALIAWSHAIELDRDVTYEMLVHGADMSHALATGRSLSNTPAGTTADGDTILKEGLMALIQDGEDVTPNGPDAEMTFAYSFLDRTQDQTDSFALDTMPWLAVHEIGHQLGFNTQTHDDFVTVWDTMLEAAPDGTMVFTGENALTANDGEPITLQGEEWQQRSHFHPDDFPNETMGPYADPDKIIGPITRAAMEDLGFDMRPYEPEESPDAQSDISDLVARIDKAAVDQISLSEGEARAHPKVPDLTPLRVTDAPTSQGDLLAFEPGANLDLGAGRDVLLLNGTRSDWQVQASADGTVTIAPMTADGTAQMPEASTYSDVETLRFRVNDDTNPADDAMIHLGGFAESEMARLYAAVFGREPDAPGLDYWIGQRQQEMDAKEIAQAFMGSQEYVDSYGTGLDDQAFLDALYDNVLGRQPDGAGNDYWRDVLASGEKDRADVLVDFTNSAENVDNTDHYIADVTQGWSNMIGASAVASLVAPPSDDGAFLIA